ncbi:hypothetical protein MTIM_35800 [Mycobacterium timonense]|uniref:Uncharacterized protein n=1 Tax=Mycobacterium timonense TaxID=701043 RepID=A0A7I9Z9M8_9MYCO|nr:hypothetical protein MTIM_35800 [Mycobacterium timonense]
MLAALTAGIRDFNWLALESSALDIHANELVIDNAGFTELSDELSDDTDPVDEADVDDSGEASCCRAVGTVEVTCDRTAWVSVLAELLTAWPTASPVRPGRPGWWWVAAW